MGHGPHAYSPLHTLTLLTGFHAEFRKFDAQQIDRFGNPLSGATRPGCCHSPVLLSCVGLAPAAQCGQTVRQTAAKSSLVSGAGIGRGRDCFTRRPARR